MSKVIASAAEKQESATLFDLEPVKLSAEKRTRTLMFCTTRLLFDVFSSLSDTFQYIYIK